MSEAVKNEKKINKVVLFAVIFISYNILVTLFWVGICGVAYLKRWQYALLIMHLISTIGCIFSVLIQKRKVVASYSVIISGIIGTIIPISLVLFL